MQRKYNVASMKNIIKRHSLIHKKNKVVVHFSTFINQPFNNDNNKQYVKYKNNIQINKNSLYNCNKYWLREFHASSSGMSMDDVLLTPVCAKRINTWTPDVCALTSPRPLTGLRLGPLWRCWYHRCSTPYIL